MEIFELLFKLILCHLIGDYVLQTDFIAKTKGDNVYHLYVHGLLYAVPFYITFGFVWQLYAIICAHVFVDFMKAQVKILPYWADQLIHYATCLIYLL